MSSIRPFTLAIGAVALVVVTACGGTTSTPSAGTSTTTSPSAGAKAAAPTGPATVKVATTTTLGKVLTDDQDRVLYMFDKDKGTGTSSCYDKCEANWPPALTAGAPVAGAGADAGLLGTSPRKDGTTQVTYKKMPVYRYAKDAKPLDTAGQAVGGIWWVLDSGGRPMQPATVNVGTTTGKALTDARGFALYAFTKDTGGTSSCYDKCAAQWPALLTTGAPKAGTGADAAMLGTTKRTDGTTQVTYNKLPVYYFTPDKAAGDLKGQGVGGFWWLVSDDGKLDKTTKPA